jgi:hypothetical protein
MIAGLFRAAVTLAALAVLGAVLAELFDRLYLEH